MAVFIEKFVEPFNWLANNVGQRLLHGISQAMRWYPHRRVDANYNFSPNSIRPFTLCYTFQNAAALFLPGGLRGLRNFKPKCVLTSSLYKLPNGSNYWLLKLDSMKVLHSPRRPIGSIELISAVLNHFRPFSKRKGRSRFARLWKSQQNKRPPSMANSPQASELEILKWLVWMSRNVIATHFHRPFRFRISDSGTQTECAAPRTEILAQMHPKRCAVSCHKNGLSKSPNGRNRWKRTIKWNHKNIE